VRVVVAARVAAAARIAAVGKSSKVRGATLRSTTAERGGDGKSGEWQQHRGSHSQQYNR